MEEIKVGEYVRTKEGVIAKVISKDGLFIDIDKKYFDECYQSMRRVTFDERITKHSPNIIDLIEVGDYVNGWKVRGKTSEKVVVDYYMYSEQLGEGQWLTFYKDNIESIVTHESFNSIKYEVV